MKFIETEIPGLLVVEPDVFQDARGYFFESYHSRKYCEGGLPVVFVQDNESMSSRGVLRGLHGQLTRPQGKLVRVIEGAIFDVAVDARRGSPTFGKWAAVELSGENFRQLYVPPGLLHGFCVLSPTARMSYKCTDFYDARDEYGVAWDDPDLAIEWPLREPLLSEKDKRHPTLASMRDRLPA